jgi:hypothetical protein
MGGLAQVGDFAANGNGITVTAESWQTEFLAVTAFDGNRHDTSLVGLNEKAPSSREDRAIEKRQM